MYIQVKFNREQGELKGSKGQKKLRCIEKVNSIANEVNKMHIRARK